MYSHISITYNTIDSTQANQPSPPQSIWQWFRDAGTKSLVQNMQRKRSECFSYIYSNRALVFVCFYFTTVSVCLYVHQVHVCACGDQMKRGRTIGIEITGGFESPGGCSVSNLVLLREHQEDVTPKPHLQPQNHLFCKFREYCLSFTFERIPRDKNPCCLFPLLETDGLIIWNKQVGVY